MRFATLNKVQGCSVLSLVALALSGCGHNGPTAERERTVAAAGTLTYQGQPLAFYQVMLTPAGHRPAAGTTDESGKFVLGTDGAADGAVAGQHKVAVNYVGPPGAGGDGQTDFSPPPAPKVKIPAKYNRAETSGLTVEVPSGGSRELKIELQ